MPPKQIIEQQTSGGVDMRTLIEAMTVAVLSALVGEHALPFGHRYIDRQLREAVWIHAAVVLRRRRARTTPIVDILIALAIRCQTVYVNDLCERKRKYQKSKIKNKRESIHFTFGI